MKNSKKTKSGRESNGESETGSPSKRQSLRTLSAGANALKDQVETVAEKVVQAVTGGARTLEEEYTAMEKNVDAYKKLSAVEKVLQYPGIHAAEVRARAKAKTKASERQGETKTD